LLYLNETYNNDCKNLEIIDENSILILDDNNQQELNTTNGQTPNIRNQNNNLLDNFNTIGTVSFILIHKSLQI
jgi:hypothetical protein